MIKRKRSSVNAAVPSADWRMCRFHLISSRMWPRTHISPCWVWMNITFRLLLVWSEKNTGRITNNVTLQSVMLYSILSRKYYRTCHKNLVMVFLSLFHFCCLSFCASLFIGFVHSERRVRGKGKWQSNVLSAALQSVSSWSHFNSPSHTNTNKSKRDSFEAFNSQPIQV